jgi:DNA replication regulator DPB11
LRTWPVANQFLSAAERLEIAELVRTNGAVYEGDLTKQITHLISYRTEGAKYKAAKSWGLRIVSPEWLHHSLERGMILDEKLYDPALPEEERGKDAWDRTKPRRTSLGKRSRDDSNASLEGGKRKLRRTASTKLSTQNDGLWGDIVGGGAVAQVSRSGIWEEGDAGVLSDNAHTEQRISNDNTKSGSLQSTIENPPRKKGMFHSCRFYLSDFPPAQGQILHEHFVFNDGEVSGSMDDLIRLSDTTPQVRLFRVVPHDLPLTQPIPLPESQPPIQTVTVWWLERCLHRKEFIDPADSVIGRPFPVFPIESFAGITISTSAFSGIDLLHVTKAVKLIGAKYSEDMTPQSTVLVTKSSTAIRKDKFDYAQEWKVPIVTADWLWDSIAKATMLSLSKYRIRSQKRSDSLPKTNGGAQAKALHRHERSKSELVKSGATSSSTTFKSSTRPPRDARLDNTAFDSEEPTIKDEDNTQLNGSLAETTGSATLDQSYKSEPLSERSINSPTRTVSTAPAPSDHPRSRPQEDISNAILNLLAKTKTAAANPAQNEASEGRKRGPGRILGRVTSNISTGSGRSRATSVDSTATHGHPVQYPPYDPRNPRSEHTANEQIDLLLHGNGHLNEDEDSQPPSTQLQYEDPDSTEAREMVMARMMGGKVQPKKTGLREKAVTVGDFMEKSRATRRAGRGSLR